MPFRFARRASDDLINIYVEGAKMFGVNQAERYRAGLDRTFAFLAEFPLAARERIELRQKPRVHRYESHLIFYRVESDGILILRVRHGREDWLSGDND